MKSLFSDDKVNIHFKYKQSALSALNVVSVTKNI